MVVSPIASGSLYTKLHQGFGDLLELGLVDGSAPRLIGGQAAGCSPVATAFADGSEVKPRPPRDRRPLARDRRPADGDLAVATAHATGGAIHAVPEDEVGECMALLAETTGVFGETAAGVTLGALRAANNAGRFERDRRPARHRRRAQDPGPVADRLQPIVVEADADAFLASVAA